MIFILGGRGFVGSAFVRYCERFDVPHAVLTRENYASYVGAACDVFINAAGNSRKPLAARDPLADFDANVRAVRASLADFRAKRYVHLSSCDVYPDCSSPAATREDAAIDLSRQSPYGFHKWMGEQCVRHAAPDWLILRCGGFVGPGLRKNMVYDVLTGGPLWIDPASALQFLHTDAAADLVFQLVRDGHSREVFNLCGSGLVTGHDVQEFANRRVSVTPGSPVVRYDVSIEKLAAVADVPASLASVLAFVKAWERA